MKIRPLKKGEEQALSKIVGLNYTREFQRSSVKEFRAMFDNPVIPPTYLVAEEKDKILGFAGYVQSWMDYHIYEVFWVDVEPARQGQGIGLKLMKRVMSEIRKKKRTNKAYAVLLTTDKPGFYEKLGFGKLLKVSNYYLMSLNLR